MTRSIAIPPKNGRKADRSAPVADAPETGLGVPRALARPPRRTAPQLKHRYQTGEKLQMTGGGQSVQRAASFCKIIALLPYEGRGVLLYRVRSDNEAFERIVPEIDLTR